MLLAAAVSVSGCGGSPAAEPRAHRADSREAPETEAPSEAVETAAEPASGGSVSCSDGSCFECGKGFCMTGFYCDEAAEGGAACSWLPSCAKKASCDCVERALGAGCRCKESGGAVSVSCG
jgi:hypothetical protein